MKASKNDDSLKGLLKGNGIITVKVTIPRLANTAVARTVVFDLLEMARAASSIHLTEPQPGSETWVGSAIVPLVRKKRASG